MNQVLHAVIFVGNPSPVHISSVHLASCIAYSDELVAGIYEWAIVSQSLLVSPHIVCLGSLAQFLLDKW
jgi:hypothetical protein